MRGEYSARSLIRKAYGYFSLGEPLPIDLFIKLSILRIYEWDLRDLYDLHYTEEDAGWILYGHKEEWTHEDYEEEGDTYYEEILP